MEDDGALGSGPRNSRELSGGRLIMVHTEATGDGGGTEGGSTAGDPAAMA